MLPLALASSAIVVGVWLTFISSHSRASFPVDLTVISIACVDWWVGRKVLKTRLGVRGSITLL